MVLLVGSVGFLLFFLYDWNRIFWKNTWMTSFFWIGCFCQIIAGSAMLFCGQMSVSGRTVILLACAVLCLLGLLYTLFFALPFDSTYCQEADQHQVCRTGIYGVCRHPGIWMFFGCFLFLSLATGDRGFILDGILLSGENLCYAWYQDRWIFPQEFLDYSEYQREVPFLLPIRKRQ